MSRFFILVYCKIESEVFFISSERQINKIESFDMSADAYTKVVEMGNIIELTSMQKRPIEPPTRRISSDCYVNVHTGDLGCYRHIDNRSGSIQSIRHTLAHIRALINTNCYNPKNVKWVTFTYADNMTDTQRLYSDYKKFWQKFLRYCKRNNFPKCDYIIVIEPQGRGAWHIHSFFIFQNVAPFIPNDDISKMWGQGFTKTKACNDCDNIGAYFSAYLADMPFDEYTQLSDVPSTFKIEEKDFEDEQGFIKSKKFVKGGRLYLYPPKMNIVRHSKGIKYPEVSYDTKENAEKKVCSAQQTFSSTFEIVDVSSSDVINIIQKSYYNKKRKIKQD